MAKLVSAACPKCGASLEIDPASEYATCAYCKTASFVQTPKRPVTEQLRRAEHAVIRVEAPGRGLLVLASIGVAALTALGAGFVAFFNARAVSEASSVLRDSGLDLKPLLSAVARPALLPVGESENLFKDASGLLGKLTAGIGSPLRLTQLVLYPEHASVRAQDPKQPEHLDDYWYRAGNVERSGPVRLSSGGKRALEASLFDAQSLDLSKLPAMLEDARRAIPVEAAEVSHIIIEKSHRELRYRVYVSSERESGGYVEYSLKGERRLVMK